MALASVFVQDTQHSVIAAIVSLRLFPLRSSCYIRTFFLFIKTTSVHF